MLEIGLDRGRVLVIFELAVFGDVERKKERKERKKKERKKKRKRNLSKKRRHDTKTCYIRFY